MARVVAGTTVERTIGLSIVEGELKHTPYTQLHYDALRPTSAPAALPGTCTSTERTSTSEGRDTEGMPGRMPEPHSCEILVCALLLSPMMYYALDLLYTTRASCDTLPANQCDAANTTGSGPRSLNSGKTHMCA